MKNCDNVLPGAECVDPYCPYCGGYDHPDDRATPYEAVAIAAVLLVIVACAGAWVINELVAFW